MFSEDDVRALVRDPRLRPPVASLYLNADRGRPEGEKVLASFRQVVHAADELLRHKADPAPAAARERLKETLPELLRVLDEEVTPQPVVRGVAMFVSLALTPDHEPRTPPFTVFTLPRPVRTRAWVSRRPHIRPLLFLLDQYERVGVIVADRHHARIFTLFLGEVESVSRRTAEVSRPHPRGGLKQLLFQRHADDHTHAHIRSTVREAVNLFGAHPLTRVVLGGSDETLALLQRELPARWRDCVVGSFAADVHASDSLIVTRALALAHAAEHREENLRVQELLDALARRPLGRVGTVTLRATAGLEQTLQALFEQRVRRLLLTSGLRMSGATCEHCGLLLAGTSGVCPYCASLLQTVPDIIERAVESAQEQGADIEFVAHNPFLEALGGVGALLRF